MLSDHTQLRIAAGVTETVSGGDGAARELIARVSESLGEDGADLCLLFATAHFEDEIESIAEAVFEELTPRSVLGTTAESVVCGATEYEERPALALWAARLPNVSLASFHLSREDVARLKDPAELQEHLNLAPGARPHFLLLADPFSVNPLEVLDRLGRAYPGRPAIGGLASAGEKPGQNIVLFDGQPLRHGMAGVALWGEIEIDLVVSQGCRPIGRHLVITEAEHNIIRALGGKTPLAAVIETLRECSTRDIELAQRGKLLVGRAIDEYKAEFSRGDFLIRSPLGFEQESGALLLNDLVRPGQTIQFHVRDGDSADDDLASLLDDPQLQQAAGALLFTCNGRGSRLFDVRDHDAAAVAKAGVGDAMAGMFCAGEIGPLGDRNYLHGFTASAAFFRSPNA